MAAQESSKVCPKCFEVNDHGATFCIECGAPFSDDPSDEGSDQEVYREITQANLHRIRGDYKDAVDTCLSILKRYPNNGTAHTLLGDIYAEQGELEQSAQWFDMALDIRPESENDRRKLESVKKRMSEQEAATTAKQLGIPESQPRTQQYVFVMTILIAIVGVGGFLIGNTVGAKGASGEQDVISTPIDLAPIRNPEPDQDPAVVNDPEPVWKGNADEAQLLETLNTDEAIGQRVLSVQIDPRIQTLTATAIVGSDENKSEIAASLAQLVYTTTNSFQSVTIRLTNGQSDVFIADVLRSDYDLAIANGGDLSQTLSGVWPLDLSN